MSDIPTQKIAKNNIPKIPYSIILFGKILQFLAPHFATSYAIKLFKTPIRFKTPQREKFMAENAQKQLVLIPEINKKVQVYLYGNSKKKVLLVHGWSGRGTQLCTIAEALVENGYMAISFDGPAHGASTGKTTMMNEFISTVNVLEKEFGVFEFAIGHSLGGMTVLNNIKQGLQIKKAVIIGSGDIITDIISDFVKKLHLNPKMTGKIKQRFFKQFNEDIDNYSASTAAKKVTLPVLVIHDTTDADVPVSCANNIRQNLKQGELLVTNNLGHRRILHNPLVINRIIEFINRKP